MPARIYVSPNAGPSNFAGKECHKNYFVVSWQNDTLHESAGQNATNLGYKKAFILAPNYQAGKDALAGFKRFFKGEIVGEIYTRLDQTDFAAEMAQIRAAKPDVVFQFHPGGLGIAFLRQYQQAGLLGTVPMVVAAPSIDVNIAEGGRRRGARRQRHRAVEHGFRQPGEQEVRREPGRRSTTASPTYYAAQGYDTALAIAAALKAIERQDLKDTDDVPHGDAEGRLPSRSAATSSSAPTSIRSRTGTATQGREGAGRQARHQDHRQGPDQPRRLLRQGLQAVSCNVAWAGTAQASRPCSCSR